MLRSCLKRTSSSAAVTRGSIALRREYASKDGLDLYDLAKQIESGAAKVGLGTAMTPQSPGSGRSQLLKLSNQGRSQLPAGFVPFEVSKPYNPYDFAPENRRPPAYRRFPQGAPSRAIAIRQDVFHQLDIDPLDEVLNCGLIAYHTTEMGRIRRRADSKLTWRNQRKMGKAIRRARAMGLIPAFSQWKPSMVRIA